MTPAEVARARWIAQEVVRDMERDVHDFDGRTFDGRTVAEYFGHVCAAIHALANVVDHLLTTVSRVEAAQHPVDPVPEPPLAPERIERP